MKDGFLKIGFLIALSGTLGSLYFSEVLKYPPCTLCWYQRICLYPLVLIFGAALWREDRGYKLYSLPLAVAGLAISVYHNLIYFGFISEALAPCTKDVSCSARQLEIFGFLSIPLMAVISFAIIFYLIVFDRTTGKETI